MQSFFSLKQIPLAFNETGDNIRPQYLGVKILHGVFTVVTGCATHIIEDFQYIFLSFKCNKPVSVQIDKVCKVCCN